jgi:hypothetical protein
LTLQASQAIWFSGYRRKTKTRIFQSYWLTNRACSVYVPSERNKLYEAAYLHRLSKSPAFEKLRTQIGWSASNFSRSAWKHVYPLRTHRRLLILRFADARWKREFGNVVFEGEEEDQETQEEGRDWADNFWNRDTS